MNFVFWQNIISPHQAPFMRALANAGHEVTMVTAETMSSDRLALGWKTPDIGVSRMIIAPGVNEVRRIVEDASLDAIHIIAGARWKPLGKQATAMCIANNRRLGILSESADPRGLAGVARRLKYTAERFTAGRHFDFVLGMGEMGVDWFRRCGYPTARLFPFIYVTETHSALPREAENRVAVLYVGRFVHLKGVDLLLRAFAMNSSATARLFLIGHGPEEKALRKLADTLGISGSVEWLGRKNNEEIPAFMAGADVLVLPSRKDGWGAVVNEALMAGTPVICSSASGSADLLREPWRGETFRTGSAASLAAALQRHIAPGRLPEKSRAQIKSWSRCIQGEAVAKYFLEIMAHTYEAAPRPVAPWRPTARHSKHYIFWQNIISPHQAPLMRALVDAGHDVTVVSEETMTPDRLAMGWKVPDIGDARIIIAPAAKEVRRIVECGPPDTIHIIAGARWKRLGAMATRQCLHFDRRLGIISETADNHGWFAWPRWMKYTAERFIRGHRFDFILAMGETGVRWFRHCGYSDQRVFPFAYLTETEKTGDIRPSPVSSTVQILFLGQCIPRKAVDVLLAAVAACADLDWKLTILGDGEFRPHLEAIASTGPCRDRIRFLPAMENRTAMQELQKVDLLVLPSHFDGWGAVVNEALMRGVPVICSDRCGASDLLRADWRGEVFAAGYVPDLAKVLRRWIAKGKKTPKTTTRIRDWSRAISGESVADYFLQIMRHVYEAGERPAPPWRKREETNLKAERPLTPNFWFQV